MTPNISDNPSSIGLKYPEHRDGVVQKIHTWLEDRRNDDGAEGLWRIHDEIYDFTSWINIHPGGSSWLTMTKGTDITEAFESHHISAIADEMLPKYYVRKAKTPRNYFFTFHEDGFYRTLKKKVRKVLRNIPDNPKRKSKFIADFLLVGYISLSILAVIFYSFTIGLVAGMFLAMLSIAAHNFFHKRDNFRMFYFDFSLMSSREWRISHVLSHHLYTNTIYDLEITVLEPFMTYLPKEKSLMYRIISVTISPGVYALVFLIEYAKRIIPSNKEERIVINKTDLLPFLIPLCMYLFGGQTFLYTILMWFWIMICGSFHFGLVGLNAAHHHPNIFHDGDRTREDRDWGLFQLDAVMDRHEINNNQFLVLTNFGDHALHHMFPTIDHGSLPYLYPALKETCQEFGVKFRVVSQLNLVVGQFLQLCRVRPNPVGPDKRKNKTDRKKKSFYDMLKPYRNI